MLINESLASQKYDFKRRRGLAENFFENVSEATGKALHDLMLSIFVSHPSPNSPVTK